MSTATKEKQRSRPLRPGQEPRERRKVVANQAKADGQVDRESELGNISTPVEIVRIGGLPAGLDGEASVHLTGTGSSWQFVAHARLRQTHLCFPRDYAHYHSRNHALRAGLWELVGQLRKRSEPEAQPIVKAAEILVGTMWLPGERGQEDRSADCADLADEKVLPQRTRSTPVPSAKSASSADKKRSSPKRTATPTAEKSHRRGRGGTQRKASKKAKAANVEEIKHFVRVGVPMPKALGVKVQALVAQRDGRWYSAGEYDNPWGGGLVSRPQRGPGRKSFATRRDAIMGVVDEIVQYTRQVMSFKKENRTQKAQRYLAAVQTYAASLTLKPKGATVATKGKSQKAECGGQVMTTVSGPKKKVKKKAKQKGSGAGGQGPVKKIPSVRVRSETIDLQMLATAPVETFDLVPAGKVPAGALVGKVIASDPGVYELVRQVALV